MCKENEKEVLNKSLDTSKVAKKDCDCFDSNSAFCEFNNSIINTNTTTKPTQKIKGNICQCNHDISDKNNTLKHMKKRKMIYPPKETYICTCCKSFFVFTRDEKGNWNLVLDN